MLNFIVLGQVPGTRIELTFQWVLLIAFILSCIVLAFVEQPRIRDLLKEATPATNEDTEQSIQAV